MAYFLAKTDPETYSVQDFAREGETVWDGVHNYQAINAIKAMRPGDTVFLYHSQSDKAIMALATVSGEPFLNESDPRHSWAVRLKFDRYTKPLSLQEIKSDPTMEDFLLIRNPRLSTMSVPDDIAIKIEEKL